MTFVNGMRPVHPGEILLEELEALEISANAFAAALDVPGNRITAILNGQRGITADTALRLSRYLGTTAEFWLNLQKSYELRVAESETGEEIKKVVKPRKEAA
jgi:addiction module HigA family antidote